MKNALKGIIHIYYIYPLRKLSGHKGNLLEPNKLTLYLGLSDQTKHTMFRKNRGPFKWVPEHGHMN